MKAKKRGRGRPKLVKPRVLSVTVRMTEDELKLMDAAIKKTGGTTRGKFVRSLVLSSI
jgi:hypothetical protein